MNCQCPKACPVPQCIDTLVIGTIVDANTAVYVKFQDIITGRVKYIATTSDADGLVIANLTAIKPFFSSDFTYSVSIVPTSLADCDAYSFIPFGSSDGITCAQFSFINTGQTIESAVLTLQSTEAALITETGDCISIGSGSSKTINELPANIPLPDDQLPFWKASNGITSKVTIEGFNSQSVIYDDLVALINANNLIPGTYYTIIDYQTKNLIPRTSSVNTGTNTPLIVQAATRATLQLRAFQAAYPNDVIHYDYTLNLCENGTTPRPGFITYRWDTAHNVDASYDWRECKIRRWPLNTTVHAAWSNATTYSRDQTATFGGFLYVSNFSGNLNHQPNNADGFWTKMFDTTLFWFHRPTAFTFGGISITPDSAQFLDCYTFHNTVTNTLSTLPRNVHIGRLHYDDGFLAANYGGTNNIVFQIGSAATFCSDISFEPDCFDSTFIIGTGATSILNLRISHLCGLLFGRSSNAFEIWGRTTNLVTGIGASRIVGNYSNAIMGDSCTSVTAQLGQTLRFCGGNVNINITGATLFFILINNVSRIFVNRPQADIALLSTFNSGTIIGTHPGAYTAMVGRISSSGSEINLTITKTFDGTAGKGLVGSVTMDDSFAVPSGYRISQIQTKQTGLVGAGAIINMGYTGNTDAGLDDATGTITALTAGTITNVQPLDIESGNDANVLVMSVKNNPVTAGTLVLAIRLSKTILV